MTELKPGWEEDALEYEGDFIVNPTEMIDIRNWVVQHGVTRPTSAAILIRLMDSADDEKARQSNPQPCLQLCLHS